MLNLIQYSDWSEKNMLQFDTISLLVIYWVVPILILAGRGAVAAYRARKHRQALQALEENITPYTRNL